MTNDGMGTTSLVYHNECKAKREEKHATKELDETILLIMEEEDAVEAI